MTVSYSTRQSVYYAGPQSAGHDYEFNFRLHDESMLQVFMNDGTTESEVDSSDYSVTLNLDQYANAGGKVTLTNELAYGSTLFIRSNLTVEQSSQLSASPNYNARAVEDALDYLAMTMQDQGRAVDEAVNVAQDAAASAASAADSAASAAADADAAADSAYALSTLQSGTPTNDVIVAGDSMQDVVWKLQGQITAQRTIAFVDPTNNDCTMTAAETAAQIIIFAGTPTGSVAVTSTSSENTKGAHYVVNLTNEIVVLDGAVELGKHASGVVVAMNDGVSFSLALPTEPAQPPAVEMSGTSYNVNDLQAGVYYYFTNASAVNLTVQTNSTKAIRDNAEFYFKRRGVGDLTLVEGTDGVDTVDIIPPKGGSLILEDGDFCMLKRTAVDVFDLVGSTQ